MNRPLSVPRREARGLTKTPYGLVDLLSEEPCVFPAVSVKDVQTMKEPIG